MLQRCVIAGVFALSAFAQSSAETEIGGTVQKVFDAMESKDANALRSLFVPGALITSLRNGKVNHSTLDAFVTRISSATDALKERMWNPVVKIDGSIAVLWAPYDFHRAGKFDHCGIDIANLVKVEGSWKIASLSFSSVTEGCAPSPLGPLR